MLKNTRDMKYYVVSLDGCDKTGKTSLVQYLARLSSYTLNILDRGPITNIVWNRIQNRDVVYDLDMWKSTLFVRLTVNIEDWKIRCKVHNEPPMPESFHFMTNAYDTVFEEFRQKGFQTMTFNTSQMTQWEISNAIIKKLDELNA